MRQSRRVLGLAMTAAVVLGASAGTASAETCADPPALPGPLPGDDAPTNTMVWLSVSPPLRELVRVQPASGGDEIAVQHMFIEAFEGRIEVYRPVEALQPSTKYLVVAGEDATTLHRFSTGAGPDETPPSVPALTDLETTVAPGIDGSQTVMARLRVTFDGDVLIADRDRTGTVLDTPHGQTALLRNVPHLEIGRGDCLASWPDAAPDTRFEVRLAAFDVAGNFSDYGSPIAIAFGPMPEPEPAPQPVAEPAADPIPLGVAEIPAAAAAAASAAAPGDDAAPDDDAPPAVSPDEDDSDSDPFPDYSFVVIIVLLGLGFVAWRTRPQF